MKRKKAKNFTKEFLIIEAKNFSTKSEFILNNKPLYNFAIRSKMIEEACQHMNQDWKWTSLELEEEAKKYQSRGEFIKKAPSAYQIARQRDLLKDITKHMAVFWEKRWTAETLQEEALRYTTKKEFYMMSKNAHCAAAKMGILKDITKHMTHTKRSNWTLEDLRLEALKFEHRSKFSSKSSGAYNAALRIGILNDICSHMKPLTNLWLRGIYAFEHSDNSVYVGLTWNYKERYKNHMSKNKMIMEKKGLDQKFITFDVFYNPEEAAIQESLKIEQYRADGWVILNKAKAGGLGGHRAVWKNIDQIHMEALRYNKKVDFHKYARAAYRAAKKMDIFDFVCSHMKKRAVL